MLVSTVAAVVYMFTNFVTVSDFKELSHTVIKAEIREIKREIREETDPHVKEYLQEELDELIDKLCRVEPNDRECR